MGVEENGVGTIKMYNGSYYQNPRKYDNAIFEKIKKTRAMKEAMWDTRWKVVMNCVESISRC